MILSDSKVLIKKIIKPGLFILISVFLGCENADDFGTKNPFETSVGVKYKEFVLPSSNIYIDSLRTDSERRILVGSFSDSETGTATAEGYFQYFFVGGTFPGDSLTLESVAAQFKVDSKMGTSTSENLIVTQSFDTLKNELIYLRTNKEELSPFFLADENIDIDDEVIKVDLLDIYGQDLFDRVKEDATYFNSPPAGSYASPTLALQFVNAQSIVSLDLESEDSWIKVFMRGAAIDTLYELEFGLLGTQYTSIERDRTGTEFSEIVENSNLDISSGQTLVEPLSGISTAFSMSDVYDFFVEEDIIINSASFSFDIQGDNERDTLKNLMIYFRKQDLSFFGPGINFNQFSNIVATDGSYARPVNNGGLNFIASISALNETKDMLELNATNFLRSLYRTSYNSDELIFQDPFNQNPRTIEDLILISTENISLKRTVLKKDGIKLKIFYTDLGN